MKLHLIYLFLLLGILYVQSEPYLDSNALFVVDIRDGCPATFIHSQLPVFPKCKAWRMISHNYDTNEVAIDTVVLTKEVTYACDEDDGRIILVNGKKSSNHINLYFYGVNNFFSKKAIIARANSELVLSRSITA